MEWNRIGFEVGLTVNLDVLFFTDKLSRIKIK